MHCFSKIVAEWKLSIVRDPLTTQPKYPLYPIFSSIIPLKSITPNLILLIYPL